MGAAAGAPVASAAQPVAAHTFTAVIVKVGDGLWSDVSIPIDELQRMRRVALLKAVAESRAFTKNTVMVWWCARSLRANQKLK